MRTSDVIYWHEYKKERPANGTDCLICDNGCWFDVGIYFDDLFKFDKDDFDYMEGWEDRSGFCVYVDYETGGLYYNVNVTHWAELPDWPDPEDYERRYFDE